jgi:hypothetical protein
LTFTAVLKFGKIASLSGTRASSPEPATERGIKMKSYPTQTEHVILCDSLKKDVILCFISVTDPGAGPGERANFIMTLRYADQSVEYIYFTQMFYAHEWYERFTKRMKELHPEATIRDSWASATW